MKTKETGFLSALLCSTVFFCISFLVLAPSAKADASAYDKILVYDQYGGGWENTPLNYGASGGNNMQNGGCHIFSYAHAIQWLTGNKVAYSDRSSLINELIGVCDIPWGPTSYNSTNPQMLYNSHIINNYGVQEVDIPGSASAIETHFADGGVIVANPGEHYHLAVGSTYADFDGNGSNELYIHIVDSSCQSTWWRTNQNFGSACYTYAGHSAITGYSRYVSSYDSNENPIYGYVNGTQGSKWGGGEYWVPYSVFSRYRRDRAYLPGSGGNVCKIQLWGIEENSEWNGTIKLWAKRFDDDINHYAVFYLDDVAVTGYLASDSGGFFSVSIDTKKYNDGIHKLSIYYANTAAGKWDIRNIVFKNIIEIQGVDEGSVWSGTVAFKAKRFNNDNNHYAIFYLDDVAITGYISADENGCFTKEIDTTQYENGDHQLSIYYACTDYGGWDVKQIVFDNSSREMNTPDFILPASLKVIDEEAFYGLPMTVVMCPEGLEEIMANAFMNCVNLKEIYIPDSVTFIDGGVFDGCSSDLTIFGHAGKLAEAYAELNRIQFVNIG